MSSSIKKFSITRSRDIKLYILTSNYTYFNAICLSSNQSADLKIFINAAESDLNVDNSVVMALDSESDKINLNIPPINKFNKFIVALIFIFARQIFCLFYRELQEQIDSAPNTLYVYSPNFIYLGLFRRIFTKAEFYLFEDGLSSYTNINSSLKYRNKYLKLADKLLFNKHLLRPPQGEYLWRPTVATKRSHKIIQIDYCKENILKMLLNSNNSQSIVDKVSRQCLYLSQPVNTLHTLINGKTCLSTDKISTLIESIQLTFKVFPGLQYRSHPKERHSQHMSYFRFIPKQDSPSIWENECFNHINDQSILICVFSSAAFVPKIIFDKEPTIIMLYRMLFECFPEASMICKSIRNSYKNPLKVLEPNSLSELVTMLKIIQKNNL
ncbi:hypothetical protein SynPROS71_00282 [Synechococcus sp. PROS-7-1]|uniref:hypothetical protein n=1 Tax=Synechococcus sp. PROS-7-1 TaxID=1442556 RepID=UPI0016447BA0|nr:hypothetical protein [Synechococcus sp. PROS-7-1]QNI84120.1 hypothetical protein SynPROS71_00282 [Synechococcus sp. PROS-7-1]